MRKELRDRVGRRGRFSATLRRFGVRPGPHPKQTALFVDVKDESGQIVTDHIWMIVGNQIRELALVPGDEIFFIARVTKYWKRNPEWQGYGDDAPQRVQDYRLSNPSKLQKLGAGVLTELPLFDREADDASA
jgi:hypothetical protein